MVLLFLSHPLSSLFAGDDTQQNVQLLVILLVITLAVALISLIFLCVLLHEFGHAFAARMFGIQGLIELGKGLAKVTLLGTMAWFWLRGRVAALEVSPTVTVEWAAVARRAAFQPRWRRPPAPQLTTMRLSPELSSNARKPAWASRA